MNVTDFNRPAAAPAKRCGRRGLGQPVQPPLPSVAQTADEQEVLSSPENGIDGIWNSAVAKKINQTPANANVAGVVLPCRQVIVQPHAQFLASCLNDPIDGATQFQLSFF
ncbi:MAG: hypothetical protein JZU64_10225 [Rhodoferax sp.]|nr:hypothetical protein [Rhodoferax sp.]